MRVIKRSLIGDDLAHISDLLKEITDASVGVFGLLSLVVLESGICTLNGLVIVLVDKSV